MIKRSTLSVRGCDNTCQCWDTLLNNCRVVLRSTGQYNRFVHITHQLLLLAVGSLRQTQFSSSQFCHGHTGLWSCTSSFVVPMALVSRLTQSIYLCFRLSLISSPRWCHLQSLCSDVFLVSSLDVSKPPQSCFPAPVMFSTVSLSLMSSFLTWYLSVWPHARLHIFISATSSFFTWKLVTGTVSIPYSIAASPITLTM